MKKLACLLLMSFGFASPAAAGGYPGVPQITGPVEPSQLNAYLNQVIAYTNNYSQGLVYSLSTATTCTAAATTQTLASYSVPANFLSTTGQALRIKGVWSHAANTNNITPVITFGTYTYTGSINATSGGAESVECLVVKSGASTQNITCSGLTQTTPIVNSYATGTSTDTAAITINGQCTQGSASADCTLATFTVESVR